MANNKTIFQRLSSIFDASGVDLTKVNNEIKNSSNTYSINNDILLKTPSKEEYEFTKLQAQQSKFLSGLWKKSENELLQHSLHYETTRIGSYADFESMEFYPEIAAALDIFMEESVTTNSKGKILNIYSESKRIEAVLEDLFFNRLDIHLSLPMWVRNVVKYGDNFLLLNIDDKNGIVGGRQLPNFEIERKEGDVIYNQFSGEYKINNESENAKVKFFWRGKDFEFNSWQIAHFRLLGDDRRLPYGTSLLEKARSIWKRLQLAEDAMLVYRITRAPERRVFKIFVGNLDDKDVPAYVDEIANRFKRKPVIDPQTGQIDVRYNQLANDQDYFIPVRDENAATPIDTLQSACIALDTKIPLLDGRTLELQEIIEEWDKGNRDLWVYSCDPETGELAPGIITWAGHTRKNAQVVKITLDNGKTITTTPDHKWVHRTKGFVEAKDLVVGDSLMPFYTREAKINNSKNSYKQTWDSHKQKWVYDHRLITNYFKNINEDNEMTLELGHKNLVTSTYFMEEDETANENYNHKIIAIEWLDDTMDTGTITVDGNEIYHNYHTFATDSGVFIKNSNLDAIGDIQYLQRKLFTALRVPKTFLGFEESVGDGKNLALQDIRFSRTINRIQQAVISELNKIAIIHLYMLGFEDELNNFNLSLNNPSTQAEMLKIEQLQAKMSVYKDAISEAGNGFMGMSMTRARREILGWTDEEIRRDLLEQRLEKAAAAEMETTSSIIKRTGMFDEVDAIYGDMSATPAEGEGGETSEGGFGGGGGGSFGGGGSLPPLSPEGGETPEAGGLEAPEAGGLETPEATPEGGGTETAPEGGNEAPEAPESLSEGVNRTSKLITEQHKNKKVQMIKEKQTHINKLLDIIDNNEKPLINERVAVYDKNLKINQDINSIINDIDDMLKD